MNSLYRNGFVHLASICGFDHLGRAAISGHGQMRCVMLFNPKHEGSFDELEAKLCHAEEVNSELMSDVIAIACTRFHALGASMKVKVSRLIEAGAWTDAALALLKLELPQWTLRRLIQEDGQWLCTLSKRPGVPREYDEVAEASHEILPLAILIAFLAARRNSAAMADVNRVPQVRPTSEYVMCCDDFS
jgi:hypothetical protein